MSDILIVEKDNVQVLQINEKEIVVIEKGFSIVQNGGGSSEWGGITGDIDLQLDLKNKLDNKVNAETGKVLSSNDYTTEEKQKLFGIENNANYYVLPNNVVFDSNYVHTDNNFTTEEKQNLANQSGANTGDETQSSINAKIGYTPANDSDVVHKTGTESIGGAKTFTSPIKADIGISNFYQIQTTSSVRIGGAILNHIRISTEAIVHNFQNKNTGSTSTDGLTIGISSIGVAQFIQRENLNLEFYTNNVKVGDISNTGVWANNSGTWSTLSDERLKENIKPVTDSLEKCLLLAKCVRHYTFKNQTKYATGLRTGYIAQLLRDNGFEGHVTYNLPVDEEEGILLGWKYDNEIYFEEETKSRTVLDEEENEVQEEYKEEVEKTRRIVVKEGEMILGIENNFVPYVFGAIEQLNNRLKALEEKTHLVD